MAAGYEALFQAAAERLEALGGRRVPDFEFQPFTETAAMLYQSAFVAERYSGEAVDQSRPGAWLPQAPSVRLHHWMERQRACLQVIGSKPIQ